MKESYVFLAEGFEEVEALTPMDVLRRAGMPVKTVSISASRQVTGAHGVSVTADMLYDSSVISDAAWLIFPGGMPGAQNLHDFAPLYGLIGNQMKRKEGHIAAICASPGLVLGQEGFLEGRKATCYPGFEKYMKGAEYTGDPVVWDDKFVLGNGPANALRWALAIVGVTLGEEKRLEVADGMLLYMKTDNQVENYFG